MSNLFDGLQALAFDTISLTMGYDATWTPSIGGSEKSARVLFNNPTESRKLSEVEYNPYEYHMEYKKGDFPGLMEAARSNKSETVNINGVNYMVMDVTSKYDGNTIIAKIELEA